MEAEGTNNNQQAKQYLDEVTGQMVSKNELKKRQKMRKKDQGAADNMLEDDKQDEKINPAEYLNNRRNWLLQQKDQSRNPYPHKFYATHRIDDLLSKFKQSAQNDVFSEEVVRITGRVVRIRDAGEGLHFYDIEGNDEKVQIYANKSQFYKPDSNWDQVTATIRRGDIIGVEGRPGKTKRGQFSVAAIEITQLSYCLHMLPSASTGLKEKETRYRQRYLDMICNPSVRKTFRTRSKIISFIRSFLQDREFIQVETPMMNLIPGGAAAKPFITKHNELNLDLYMRVAPELYLKMLVVGGMERVFQIGKNFRNEGIDHTHNPQFTACEFYMAYADYHDLMNITEEMISQMVYEITGGYKIKYHPLGQQKQIEIDFTTPWPRISMIKELEKIMNVSIPRDFQSQQTRDLLTSLIQKHKVECDNPRTTNRMLDKLVGHFIEPKCINPAFIIDHPAIMCPLAKWHRSEKGLTQRFELFVNGNELCNAYTELNDPKVQRDEFLKQAGAKDEGEQQTWEIDEGFCTALEYGLPPTAGWGIGIDRMAMLLTDQNSIKEVLLFPAMKPLPGTAGYKEKAPESLDSK